MVTIGKRFTFESAHYIKDHPTCGNLHGHSWVLDVMLKGTPDPKTGFLLDFKVLGGIVREITNKIDHKTINTAIALDFSNYPVTAETLVQWFVHQLRNSLNVVLGYEPDGFPAIIGCRLQEGIDGGWAEYWEEP